MSQLWFHLHKLEASRYGRRAVRSLGASKGCRILSYIVGVAAKGARRKGTMRLTPWYLAAIAPVAVAGCSGAFLGHFAVLALTFGIFFGTLSLGRQAVAQGDEPQAKVDVRRAS